MDFTKPITFSSLDINTVSRGPTGAAMSGYQLDSFDQSNVEVAAFAEKRALRDGVDASDVYLGRRRVSAIVTVFGSTLGDFWDKTQALLAAFSPTLAFDEREDQLGFLAFDFFQPTADIVTWPTSAYPDGIPLRYYLRPSAPPAYISRRDFSGGTPGLGLSNQYNLSLVARRPGKVSVSQATTTSDATNLGDYPTRPSIVISSSSATGNASIQFTNSPHAAESLLITIDAASATYTADCDRGLFYKGSTVRMDLVRAGSVFPTLYPGVNVKVSTGALVNANSSVVFWHTFA